MVHIIEHCVNNVICQVWALSLISALRERPERDEQTPQYTITPLHALYLSVVHHPSGMLYYAMRCYTTCYGIPVFRAQILASWRTRGAGLGAEEGTHLV